MNKQHVDAKSAGFANSTMPTELEELSPFFVRFAIVVIMLSSILALIFLRLFEPEQPIRSLGPALLLLLSASGWFLIRSNKMQATVYVMVFGGWVTVTVIILFTGRFQAPIIVAYPLIILLAGWLIGQRAALTVTALSVLATLFIVIENRIGILPALLHTEPAFIGAVHIIIYIMSSLLVTYLVRTQNRVEELRILSRALGERTSELESGKTELQRAQAVAKVGSWIYDIEQDFIRLSDETCRIFALPKGTTGTLDSYLERVYSKDREGVYNAWKEASKGKAFAHEHRIIVGDGLCWISQKADIQFVDGKAVRAEGITQDISERKRSEEKIYTLAFFDHLTNLPNRRLLQDRLQQMMAVSERNGTYGSLLFLDLDYFKTLNDTRGHDVGDILLKQVAQRLSLCVREGDSVARLGGDEFVILLSNLGTNRTAAASGTELVCEKILMELRQAYQLGSVEHFITASIGATLFRGTTTPIDNLLKQADLTMYKAKAAGRNRCCFFDPALETAVLERATMERNLRSALTKQEFELHYQLQITANGQFTGAEVLLRWHLPHHGVVTPAEFIALAEETGLIIPLGHWVLHTACTQLASWASQPAMAALSLSVNVSVRQFNQPDFVAMVLSELANTGARADRLTLELTENLLVDNVQIIVEKMNALKSRGVSFSLDDFGTGYSSLAYLKQLPLAQLKIDRSFVNDILTDSNDATIARTIVALAQSFGLGVIAEGVETKAQYEALARIGCHAYQGYFFSRPIPLVAFEQLILQAYSAPSDH